MANKCMERCSISLVIREIKIEILVRYHYAPTRMIKIMKAKTPRKRGAVEKLELSCIAARNVNGPITLENWQILIKLNIYRPYDLGVPPIATCARAMKAYVQDLYKNVHSSFFHNGPKLEISQMAINR